jgi:hypothetical protein
MMNIARLTLIFRGLDDIAVKAKAAADAVNELRQSIEAVTVESVDGGELVPSLVHPPAPKSQAATKGADAGSKTKHQRRAATAKAVGASVGSLHGRLVDILRDAGEPMAFAQLLAQAKAPKLSVRLALKELASDGKVLATGNTTTRRFALVRGRKAAAVPPSQSQPVTSVPARMGDAIDQALRKGSALDKRALLEAARKHFPLVEMSHVEAHLKLRLSEGTIERMPGAVGDVYRAVQ